MRGRGLCLVADLAGVPRRHPAGLLDAGVPELLVPVDELREATAVGSTKISSLVQANNILRPPPMARQVSSCARAKPVQNGTGVFPIPH